MSDPTKPDNPTHAQNPLSTWRSAFITALAINGNVSAAARAAEVNRQYCYECRTSDPGFAEEWDEALVMAVEGLEERAWNRALFKDIQYKFHPKTGQPLRFPEGHPLEGKPYFEYVGSDAVLLRLMEAHKPDLYKPRSAVDLNGTLKTEPKHDLTKLSTADLLAWRDIQRKLQVQQEGAGDAS
jgi:hypothetical protein